MKAVITVIGKDAVGIIARVSGECSAHGVNIMDITQSVMKEYFTMIMLVELEGLNIPFNAFVDHMNALGREAGLEIQPCMKTFSTPCTVSEESAP